MLKKQALLIALILTLVVCQPAFATSMGEHSRVGAVVGKVITYDQNKNKYIVYGRISFLTENGFRVYETGKFYSVSPDTEKADKLIKENMNKGIKAFGYFEAVKQTINQETLVVNRVEEYDPSMDSGIMEPAYGPKIGPDPWMGFGIPISAANAQMMTLKDSWDFIYMLEQFKQLLPTTKLRLQIEDKKHKETFVENLVTKEEYNPIELAEYLSSEIIFKPESSTGDTTFKKPYRAFWQSYFKEIYLMEKSEEAYQDIIRAIKGYSFMETQKGRLNHLVEQVPVIRPEIDIFMKTIENLVGGTPQELEKWATPAVLYGKIEPYYNIVQTIDPKTRKIHIKADYTGPYYADLDQLIYAISYTAKKESLPSTPDTHNNNNIEKWQIGWNAVSEDDITVPGLTIKQALGTEDHPTWMIGTRVLVYKIVHTSPEGKTTISYSHCEHGKMEEGTFTSADGGSTTVTFYGHYIKPWIDVPVPYGQPPQKIASVLVKPAYNYLLTALREVAFKGGF